MADIEKTLKGLECCHKMGVLGLPSCDELECPYFKDRLSCWLDVLSDAIELESRQNASGDGASLASQFLKPVDWLLAQSPAVTLDEALAKRYRHGQRLSPVKEGIDVPQGAGRYRIYGPEGVFLGTAKLRDDGILAPERLVALREH